MVDILLIVMMLGIAGALVAMRMKPKPGQKTGGPGRRPANTTQPVRPASQPGPLVRSRPAAQPAGQAPAAPAPVRQIQAQPQQAQSPTPIQVPPALSAIGTPGDWAGIAASPSLPAAPSPVPVALSAAPAAAPAMAPAATMVLVAPTAIRLEVTAGPEAGIPYLLLQGDNHLGRSPQSHVQVTDATVSNQHAIFRVAGGQVMLFDNASTNGTFVNGRQVLEPVELHHGDQVTVGQTTLVLHVGSSH